MASIKLLIVLSMVAVAIAATGGRRTAKITDKTDQEKVQKKKDFCDSKNPAKVVEKMDDCLADEDIKAPWLKCQEDVLGSDDPQDVADAYCSKEQPEKKAIGKRFSSCLKAAKVS